jgi:hypothetical protein
MKPYAPRPISRLQDLRSGDWTLKRYSIRYGDAPFDAARFDGGRAMALGALPIAARDQGRCGAGFLIEHQGEAVDYLVLGWWDRQNELPLRVYVREGGAAWRTAKGGESVCVWDLQVIWAERQAYVDTVMNRASRDGVADYLRHDTLSLVSDAGERAPAHS